MSAHTSNPTATLIRYAKAWLHKYEGKVADVSCIDLDAKCSFNLTAHCNNKKHAKRMKKENGKKAGEKDDDTGFTRQRELEMQMDKGLENEEDEMHDLADAIGAVQEATSSSSPSEQLPAKPTAPPSLSPPRPVKGVATKRARPIEASDSESEQEGESEGEGTESSEEDEEDEEEEFERVMAAVEADLERQEQEAAAAQQKKKAAAEKKALAEKDTQAAADQIKNNPDLDGGEETLADGEVLFDWGDLGRSGDVLEELAHSTQEDKTRRVTLYDSVWQCNNKVSMRTKVGDYRWFEFEDGKPEIVEIRSFFDDNRTGEMMCEVYHHHANADLHRIPYFNKKKGQGKNDAEHGWNARQELIQDAYPSHRPVLALRGAVVVSNNGKCPTTGHPRGNAQYFYRYRCNNKLNTEMMPRETLKGMKA